MKNVKKTAGLLQEIGAKNSPTDTILAHITPNEAAMLKANGGSGRTDPQTGLMHFEEDGYSNFSGGGWGGSSGDAYGQSAYGSSGQSYEPMNPAQYKTLGGMLANAFGYDPQGTGSKVADTAINALGLFNPIAGMAGKVGQLAARNSSSDMPAPMIAAQSQPSIYDALAKQAIGFGAGTVVGGITGNGLLASLASTAAKSIDFGKGTPQKVDDNAMSRTGGAYSQTMAAVPQKAQQAVQDAQTYSALPFSGSQNANPYSALPFSGSQNANPYEWLKYGYRSMS